MSTVRRAVVVAVVAALAIVVAAEVVGRVVVEGETERRLRDAGVGAEVEVVVGRFWWKPSVLPALLGGNVDRVEVQLRDAEMYPITVSVAEYVLQDLDVSVDVLGRDVEVRSAGSTRVRLLVDPSRLGVDLGIKAQVVGSDLRLGPDALPAEVHLEGDDLVVSSEVLGEEIAEGGELRLTTVDPYVIPCPPEVRLDRGLVMLRCTSDRLPGILEQHLSPAPTEDLEELPPGPVELGPPASVDLDDEGTTTTTPEDDGG